MRYVGRLILLVVVLVLALAPAGSADSYCDNSNACYSTCWIQDSQGNVRKYIIPHPC
jgi:hypothetical protein